MEHTFAFQFYSNFFCNYYLSCFYQLETRAIVSKRAYAWINPRCRFFLYNFICKCTKLKRCSCQCSLPEVQKLNETAHLCKCLLCSSFIIFWDKKDKEKNWYNYRAGHIKILCYEQHKSNIYINKTWLSITFRYKIILLQELTSVLLSDNVTMYNTC